MATLKTITAKRSIWGLIIMAGFVIIPLFLSFVFQAPLVAKGLGEPDAAGHFIKIGAIISFVGGALGIAIFLIPATIQGLAAGHEKLSHYVRISTLWIAAISALLGVSAAMIAASSGGAWISSLLATTFFAFIALGIPSLMAMIGYWFLAIRLPVKDGTGRGGMGALCTLFILWNLEAFITASAIASTLIEAPK